MKLAITHCILEAPEEVLWQKVKIKMKCRISSGSALFAKIEMIVRDWSAPTFGDLWSPVAQLGEG